MFSTFRLAGPRLAICGLVILTAVGCYEISTKLEKGAKGPTGPSANAEGGAGGGSFDVGTSALADRARCTVATNDGDDYQVCDGASTWNEARRYCASKFGSELATVASADVNSFLAKHVAGGRLAWLGANASKKDGAWRWAATGDPIKAAAGGSFVNWPVTEPTSGCLGIASGGQWSARDCNERADVFFCHAITVKWEALQGGEVEELPEAIPAEQSRALVKAFSWATARPMPERDPKGRPALRYVQVYITSNEEREALQRLSVNFSFSPLFAAERKALWGGKVGYHSFTGDGLGAFAFAVLPAKVYNLLLNEARRGRVIFRAVIARDPKVPEALLADGSLSYEYLKRGGFTFYPKPDATESSMKKAGDTTVEQNFFGDVLNGIGKGVDILGDSIEDFAGGIDQALSGSRKFTIRVRLTDLGEGAGYTPAGVWKSDYMSPAVNGRRPRLRRTWGADIGTDLTLPNVRISAENDFIGQHTGDTNADGVANITAADGRDYTFCVLLRNNSAQIASNLFTTPIQLCDYTGRILSNSTTSVSNDNELDEDELGKFRDFTLEIEQRHAQMLALVSDADLYLKRVMKKEYPYVAKILVGATANDINNPAGAYTPCYGSFGNWAAETVTDALSAVLAGALYSIPIVGQVAALYSAISGSQILSSDIVIKDNAVRDRGVLVHEWGHFVMCEILDTESSVGFGTTWSTVILQSFSQDGNDETSMMSEGWADFFSSQVVGGTNYFGTAPLTGQRWGALWYCDPEVTSCLDDNVGGPKRSTLRPLGQLATTEDIDGAKRSHRLGIARFTTLLTDIVDGQQTFPATDDPGNGAAWAQCSARYAVPTPVPATCPAAATPFTGGLGHAQFTLNDEDIELPGEKILEIFRKWFDQSGYNDFDKKHLAKAIVSVLQNEGYTDLEICQLFALHEKTGQCPRWLPIDTNIAPSPPFPLSGQHDANGHGVWTWEDDSPFADYFWISLVDITDPLNPHQLAHQRIDHGTSPTKKSWTSYNPLDADSKYRFQVITSNGHLDSDPAVHVLVTPARPVTDLDCDGDYERVALDWNGLNAHRFLVEYRPQGSNRWETAATVESGAADIRGLEGATTFEFRVTSLNLIGEPTAPSNIMRCSTYLPQNRVYVSASDGSDSNPGTAAQPLKTIVRATQLFADQIYLAGGTYTYPTTTLPRNGLQVRITGGYTRNFLGTWSQTGAATMLQLTNFEPTGRAFAGGLESVAGLIVPEDYSATFENLQIVALPAATETRCTVAVFAANAVFKNTSVSTKGAPNLSCRGGIHVHSDGPDPIWGEGDGPVRIRQGSWISGYDVEAGTPSAYQLMSYGIKATGEGAELIVSDSTVSALTNPGPSIANSAALTGIEAEGETVTVARSTVSSVAQAPDWKFGGGAQIAVSSHVRRTVVHNSVLRATGAGGYAIYGLGVGGEASETDVIQSTIVIGDDFNGGVGRPAGARGADVVIAGTPARINLRNNLFSYAGMGTPSFDTVLSTLDLSGMTDAVQGDSAVQTVHSVGNVFSIPEGLNGNTWSTLFCFNDEFGYMWDEVEMNHGYNYACYATGYSYSYDARGNEVLSQPAYVPPACTSDAMCSAGYRCLLGTGRCEAQQAPVVEVLLTGAPVATVNAARTTLQTAALGLEFPDDSTWMVDITGAQRSGATRQHVGAFIIR